MWLKTVTYQDQEITNERLALDAKDTLYHLGPNLILRGCTLVTRVSAQRLTLSRVMIINCNIEVKQELKNFRWYWASLKGCRFTGRMSGCDFGQWPGEEGGGIEGCDFTAAYLDACRFVGCDTNTIRFPSWPCFTILDSFRRSRELNALQWPGDIGKIVMKTLSQDPPSTVAVTYSAPALAKRRGTTEEALKAVLEQLDGVRY